MSQIENKNSDIDQELLDIKHIALVQKIALIIFIAIFYICFSQLKTSLETSTVEEARLGHSPGIFASAFPEIGIRKTR